MCCLFGFLDYKNRISGAQKRKLLQNLLLFSEERGTDAAGIAYAVNGNLKLYKRPIPAGKLKFHLPSYVSAVMGHARMATQGDASYNNNNHPWIGRCGNTPFAFAHNGVICNDKEIRKREHLPETNIATDSYVMVQALEKQKVFSTDSIRSISEMAEGTLCFTLMDSENNIYIVKGNNPIEIRHFEKLGLYVYASTKEILNKALSMTKLRKEKQTSIVIEKGEILKMSINGKTERCFFSTSKLDGVDWDSVWTQRYFLPWKKETYQEDYIKLLVDYAGNIGVSEEEIWLLLDCGCTEEEIEELLSCPSLFYSVLEDVLESYYIF